MKFPVKDFFSKCDQIYKKSLMGNFIFCAVYYGKFDFYFCQNTTRIIDGENNLKTRHSNYKSNL